MTAILNRSVFENAKGTNEKDSAIFMLCFAENKSTLSCVDTQMQCIFGLGSLDFSVDNVMNGDR